MRIFFFIWILFIAKSSLSQNTCVVFQNELSQPVAYVSVSVKPGYIMVGDSTGKLCTDFSLFLNDSVMITAIGYENKKVSISELKGTISLSQQSVILPEVILVSGEGNSETWGTKENPGLFGYGCSNSFRNPDQSIGRIVFPEGIYKKATIEAVSFYDKTGKNMASPVRLRIFLLGKDSLLSLCVCCRPGVKR